MDEGKASVRIMGFVPLDTLDADALPIDSLPVEREAACGACSVRNGGKATVTRSFHFAWAWQASSRASLT